MRISQDIHDQMVAHAKRDLPNECCGLVACEGDRAVDVYPMTNVDPGAISFTMDPRQQLLTFEFIEELGQRVGAFYHSHPGMSPVPSFTDVHYAEAWPGIDWIIVGHFGWGWISGGSGRRRRPYRRYKKPEPDVWNWRIEGGRIFTADLVIEKES